MSTGPQQPPGVFTPPPPVPPTQAGPLLTPERQSQWPTVIGIITLVLGILGTLCGVWGMIATRVFSGMTGMEEVAPNIEVVHKWATWTTVLTLFAIGFAILLIAVGAGLTGRKRWSGRLAVLWSVLNIPYVCVYAVVMYFMQTETFEAIAQDPNAAQAMAAAPQAAPTMGLMAGSCTFLIGCALPVFLLIWFGRRKIREEIATWN